MILNRYGAGTLALFLSLLLASVPLAAQKTAMYKGAAVQPGKILVKYDRSATARFKGQNVRADVRAQEVLAQVSGSVSRKIGTSGFEVWSVSGDIEKAVALARTIPGALAIPNYVFKLPKTQRNKAKAFRKSNLVEDPYLADQWALSNEDDTDIDAVEAWAIQREAVTADGDSIYVVVFDTGIDKSHPDLIGNAVPNATGYNYDAVYDSSEPEDGDGHGTHVAGTIGAVGGNGVGVSGVAQKVKIIDVRVLNEDGEGSMESILAGYDFITSLLTVENLPIAAVNQSLGGYVPFDEQTAELKSMLENVAKLHASYGTVWVVAAGNDAQDLDYVGSFSFPGELEASNIISVGSTTIEEGVSDFSNFGSYSVNVGAPGSDILSTVPTSFSSDPYEAWSGTSMAAPHVAGTLALAAAQHPNESAVDRVSRIYAGADYFQQYGSFFTAGARLNAYTTVAPDSNAGEYALLAANQVRFNISAIDTVSTGVASLVNTTDSTIDVNSVVITGTHSAHFSIVNPLIIDTLISKGSFGMDLVFDPMDDDSTKEFNALLTVTTEVGTVEIDLQAFITSYPYLVIDPLEDYRAEPIAWGETATSAFTISNEGDGGLLFGIEQLLLMARPDSGDVNKRVLNRVKYRAPAVKSAKKGAKYASLMKKMEPALEKAVASSTPKRIKMSKTGKKPAAGRINEHIEETVLWSDDLNQPDSVSKYWSQMDLSDSLNTTVWTHQELEADDFAFVFGDLDNGYTNNAFSIVLSPAFDFSALGSAGTMPAYLYFDYAAMLEPYLDAFLVGVFVQGELVYILGETDFELWNDGSFNLAALSLSDLMGAPEVQFGFIGYSDESEIGGFGAVVDNLAISTVEAPYFSSQYSGSVLPGGSTEVEVSVRTGMLPEGRFGLLTGVFSNASNEIDDIGFGIHVFGFGVKMDLKLDVAPSFVDLGNLSRNSIHTSGFSLTNSGTTALEYRSMTGVRGNLSQGKMMLRSETKPLVNWMKTSGKGMGKRISTGKMKPSNRFDRIMKAAAQNTARPKSVAKAKPAPANRLHSKVFKTPSVNSHTNSVYYEDFEGSDEFPVGWDVYDLSDSGGTVWQITQLNKGDNDSSGTNTKENVVIFGDKDSLTFAPGSYTVAYSPYITFPQLDAGTRIHMELDYASLLEPEYDVFALFVEVYNPETDEYDPYLLGTSEDIFTSDGEFHYANFDLTELAGLEAYFSFFVETDDSVNEGAFVFDNIIIDAVQMPAWTTPEAGLLNPEQTQEVELNINTGLLWPGEYAAFTIYLYGNELSIPRFTSQTTLFSFLNQAPVAVNDTLAVRSGDIVPAPQMGMAMIENDTDGDGDQLIVLSATEPVYGDWKFLTFDVPFFWDGPTHYVAPLNYDGWDRFEYLVTDGWDLDTAVVHIAVHQRPQFVRGVQQQYTVLEDTALVINSMKLASGVGGVDRDLRVWGRSLHRNVMVESSVGSHAIRFRGTADFWGQTSAMLYVGHENAPLDSMRVTVVVVPVNDAPTAKFEFETVDGKLVFTDRSDDAKDPEGAIAKWHWDFGNGKTSDEQNPTAIYSESGLFTVKLTVTDNGGLTSEYSSEITATSNEGKALPVAFAVQQNYPNPFNPSTSVRFDLPSAAQVTVSVYNTLGQLVASVMQNTTVSAGQHTVAIDAAKLASGLYLYRVDAKTADGKVHSAIRKMTLLK